MDYQDNPEAACVKRKYGWPSKTYPKQPPLPKQPPPPATLQRSCGHHEFIKAIKARACPACGRKAKQQRKPQQPQLPLAYPRDRSSISSTTSPNSTGMAPSRFPTANRYSSSRIRHSPELLQFLDNWWAYEWHLDLEKTVIMGKLGRRLTCAGLRKKPDLRAIRWAYYLSTREQKEAQDRG
jgi:hypothetical protein